MKRSHLLICMLVASVAVIGLLMASIKKTQTNPKAIQKFQSCKVVVVPIAMSQKNKCYSCEREMRNTAINNIKQDCDMWTCPHATAGIPKLGYV